MAYAAVLYATSVMSLLEIFQWFEHSALGMGIRDSDWLFYFIESLHVFGIILMVGTVAMVDLRLLNVGILRLQSVSEVAGQFLPWTWTGFGILFVTGSFLLISEAATKLYVSPSFWIKMSLIFFAGVNMTIFHFTVYRHVNSWDQAARTPRGARIAACISLTLWTGVVFAGRGIAYY
jgi:hypothetical protein